MEKHKKNLPTHQPVMVCVGMTPFYFGLLYHQEISRTTTSISHNILPVGVIIPNNMEK